MENELISVVVPVYNVENYLKRCITSIINQTYKNLEIILVDDGSTDGSSEICDKFSLKESRIKVVHKNNGGLSDARNVGIEIATGKYITFIDSDDYVLKDYVEYLYNLIKKYNTKIAICSYSVFTDKGKIIDYGKKYREEKLNKIQTFSRMLNEKGFSVSAWGKLYDTTLFKKIRYPKNRICEDNGTTYKLIDQVENIIYGNKSKYFYLKRQGSIMLSEFNEKKLDMIYLTDEMCDFLDDKYSQLYEETQKRRVYARFNVLRQILNCKYENKKIEKELIEYILKRRKKILFTNYDLRTKIAVICISMGKNFFKSIWKLYYKIKY